MISEPVQSLLSNSVTKASAIICKLVLIFLSQFSRNLRHFSSQANECSIIHRFGITTNLCNSLRFATSTVAPMLSFISEEKFSPYKRYFFKNLQSLRWTLIGTRRGTYQKPRSLIFVGNPK